MIKLLWNSSCNMLPGKVLNDSLQVISKDNSDDDDDVGDRECGLRRD
jgi:hypothetical protein